MMVLVGPDCPPAGGIAPSAKLMSLSAHRVNGSWGTRAAQSPGVVSVRVCGRDPLAAPERRRVESWAVGYGRLRDRPTPLMMAASSASEKGLDGDTAGPGMEGEAEAGEAELPDGPLGGGVPPGVHAAKARRTAARHPRPRLLFRPGVAPPCFTGPRTAISGLLCHHARLRPPRQLGP